MFDGLSQMPEPSETVPFEDWIVIGGNPCSGCGFDGSTSAPGGSMSNGGGVRTGIVSLGFTGKSGGLAAAREVRASVPRQATANRQTSGERRVINGILRGGKRGGRG